MELETDHGFGLHSKQPPGVGVRLEDGSVGVGCQCRTRQLVDVQGYGIHWLFSASDRRTMDAEENSPGGRNLTPFRRNKGRKLAHLDPFLRCADAHLPP